ncbi:hypothetical protein UK23_38235 [Lentzea aerocolonigenes]|uniref:Uncharacterized protein n=1 Tax=Lentzea aerocolonigenes TaxID=68170 RepID=A0A0F0GFU7_LENAE|nr:hypothetical protein [Lentzea aerocolonigenes]KJK42210.1 hypothetical protein UK23_38235 [Lentzea aerocolonigenes]
MDTMVWQDEQAGRAETPQKTHSRIGFFLGAGALLAFVVSVVVTMVVGPFSDARSVMQVVVMTLGGLLAVLALLRVVVLGVLVAASARRSRR